MKCGYPIRRKAGPPRRFPANEVTQLVERFGSNPAFAEITGLPLETVKNIIKRNLIPVQYWPAILDACRRAHFHNVDAGYLVDIYIASFKRSRERRRCRDDGRNVFHRRHLMGAPEEACS